MAVDPSGTLDPGDSVFMAPNDSVPKAWLTVVPLSAFYPLIFNIRIPPVPGVHGTVKTDFLWSVALRAGLFSQSTSRRTGCGRRHQKVPRPGHRRQPGNDACTMLTGATTTAQMLLVRTRSDR